MLNSLRFIIALCMIGSGILPLYATVMSDETPVASKQLSISEVYSSSSGAEFAVREELPALDAPLDPRADTQARPFSAGLLWVLPAGTEAVTVDVIPYAWREAAPGEISDSLRQVVRDEPLPLGTAGQVAMMRGIPLSTFSFNALQPSEDGQNVRICTDYRVQMTYTRSGSAASTRNLSPTFMDVIASVAGNLDELPPVPERHPEPYLVIHKAGSSVDALQDFADWKRQRGHTVTVVSTDDIGGTTKEDIRDYIQNAYDTWDEPPVFVVLVGDNNGSYAIPTFMVSATYTPLMCTDHPYTMIDGEDYLPDVLIGRLSVDTETELRTVVAKTVYYEKTPYEPDGAWRTRALMIGAYRYYPNLTSAWETKLWIRDRLLDHGYTVVDTVRYPGGSPGQISQRINNGVSFVNYRGFGSPSGWWPPSFEVEDVQNLSNGWKLPIVTGIVCGGGDFVSYTDPCFGEAWIREGTPNNPKGAVAFCGPSEHDTKTRWNNTLDAGMYLGILYEGINTFGAAQLRGKMEVMRQFPNNLAPGESFNSVHFYFHTYNILGDPGLTYFVGAPRELSADFDAEVALGQPALEIITMSEEEPLAETWATVSVGDEVFSRGVADTDGRLSLPLPQSDASDVTVTITKPLYEPIIETVVLLSSAESFVGATVTDFVDDGSNGSSGNGDEFANPGEIIALQPHLYNFGGAAYGGGELILQTSQVSVTILDSVLTVPSLASGADALPGYVRFKILEATSDGALLHLEWRIEPSDVSWVQDVDVMSPVLWIQSTLIGGEYRFANPGETAIVDFSLGNMGRASLPLVSVTLRALTSGVDVIDSTATFAEILPGDSSYCTDDGFQLTVSSDLIPGDVADLLLVLQVNDDEIHVPFSVSIGELTSDDPTPKDAYGYRAYEDTDIGYREAPALSWVEINPNDGGPGSVIWGLTDDAEGDDKSRTVDLPFPFKYYGQTYTQVTICTNGWIAMGNTNRTDFRNYALPAPLSPLTLIAPFWDDLVTESHGRICTWHDDVGHRFIIEWNNLTLLHRSEEQTFQVILYDPACWPTATGDGEILFQYEALSNSDTYENFATVGIQKPDLTTACQITHASIRAPGTGMMRANKAILFTTGRSGEQAYVQWVSFEIDDDTQGGSSGNGDGIAQNGETIELTLQLQNLGLVNSPAVIGILSEDDSYVTLLDSAVTIPSIHPGETITTTPPLRLQISPTCPNGRGVGFLLTSDGDLQPCVMLPTLQVVGPELTMLDVQIDDDNSGQSQGNGNSEFNASERIELTPGVSNSGGSPAFGVSAMVQRVSGPATMEDSQADFGDVPIGEDMYASDPAVVRVWSSAEDGDEIVLRFVVEDQYGTAWELEETYVVAEPELYPVEFEIMDPPPGGDGDGFLLAGEIGELYLRVANEGLGTATNVHAFIESMDPNVTVLDDEIVIGTVSGHAEVASQDPFVVSVSETADVPATAHMRVTLYGDDDATGEGDIYLILGNAYFFNDFENPMTNNWGHYGRQDYWHLQTRHSASPTHAFYFGEYPTYPELSDGSLFSTAFPFDGDGTLQFKTRYHMQEGRDNCRIDIQVSMGNWMPVDTLTGHQDEWIQMTIPLEGFPAFSSTRLRFTFFSDASVNDEGFYLDDVIVLDDVISSVEEERVVVVPGEVTLEQNWPNPFNGETKIRFSLPSRDRVRIAVYDILGRQVALLLDEERSAGVFDVYWKPERLASGIYFARLEAGTARQTRKMLLLK